MSSYSDGLQCVELSFRIPDEIVIRSTKDRDFFTREEIKAFALGVINGEFNHFLPKETPSLATTTA